MIQVIVDGVARAATPQEVASVADAAPVLPPEPPVPSLTRRQLLLALTGAGFLTPEEALAAATTGAVPAALAAVMASLPLEDQLGISITWASMAVAERSSPLWALLTAAGIATEEQIDALFVAGATL
jgi:hypothetical protein